MKLAECGCVLDDDRTILAVCPLHAMALAEMAPIQIFDACTCGFSSASNLACPVHMPQFRINQS